MSQGLEARSPGLSLWDGLKPFPHSPNPPGLKHLGSASSPV